MTSKRDYYEILSVSRSATEIEIKKAYRILAKKYHPDLNPNDAEAETNFKEASEAYEVLKDPQKRSTYDRFGHQGLENQGFHGFSNMEDVFSSFGDIFESFFGFGRSQPRSGPQAGADIESQTTITLVEAANGVKKQIQIEVSKDCHVCEGLGHEKGYTPETCSMCQGYGQVQQNRGFISIATPCPQCRGQGQINKKPCKTCKGSTREIAKEKIDVDIPKGVESGMHVRISHKGHFGSKGGPQGDLYVQVLIEEHPHLVRRKEHIFSFAKIGIAQASLGSKVMVETLEGSKSIEIPRGSQNGDQVVLQNEGMPILGSNRKGNHYVEVKVLVPKRLSTKQEELMREFATESGEKVIEPSSSFLDKCKKKK